MKRLAGPFQSHDESRPFRAVKEIAYAILAASALVGMCRAQTPGRYRIDLQASRIEIHLFRGGLLAGLGDNHLIVIGNFSGTASGTPEGSWEVRIRAETALLKVEDPGLSDATRQEIRATMLGPTQLDTERYPSIELRSRAVLPGGTPNSWRLQTDLTLYGVTRQVEFPLVWSQEGDRLEVKGKTTLRLRDFNIEPISKGFGTVKVKNEFEVVYDITLRRES